MRRRRSASSSSGEVDVERADVVSLGAHGRAASVRVCVMASSLLVSPASPSGTPGDGCRRDPAESDGDRARAFATYVCPALGRVCAERAFASCGCAFEMRDVKLSRAMRRRHCTMVSVDSTAVSAARRTVLCAYALALSLAVSGSRSTLALVRSSQKPWLAWLTRSTAALQSGQRRAIPIA